MKPVPILLLMLVLVQNGESVWLSLPESGVKCVREEIHNNVVVIGEYLVMTFEGRLHSNPTISVTVTSPNGNILHHKENVTHEEFSFTSSGSGLYMACFLSDHPDIGGKLSVSIDWRVGVAAKDWDSIAKKEHIDGVELELRKLEGAVDAIHENMIYRMRREAKMRGVSETTNSRVALYSISSLSICILASCAQLWYLTHNTRNDKRSFKQKKRERVKPTTTTTQSKRT
ncbi:putative transmembrane emp24 domain-containing protein [Helianthus annuus]|nr:putative transmembrane emp24 domain-containing protein [Helianthus annuus]KAJ0607485.1 putative transmembrane emp24 domain-containing protein [Helianthus annuus]KAJ0767549.1 putative transmembrane emp24 domain-containing protein [Helianthus annuus]KAJ0773375.1 putative transmembrane emp24 domain-containing protein [Helianthus annuus]